MEKIRLGVVGMGHRGKHMLKMACMFDCVIPAAVCDIKTSNWYSDNWGVGVSAETYPDTVFYEDYDKMLAEANLDLVFVETGADIHASFCIKALEKDINVLTDIPVVASLKEAEDLWKAHLNSKASIFVGANPNYQKFTVLLNEFHKKGLLGNPYCMEAEYIHWTLPGSSESIMLSENGDWRKLLIPIRYCTHSLGPLLTILDEPLRKVSCFGTGMHADEKYVAKKDDMMLAQFQTDSGVVIRFTRNGRCRAKIGHHNYRVFGSEGYMERMDRMGNAVIRYNSMKELDIELKEIDGAFMPPAYENDENAKKAGHGGMDYAMLDTLFKALLKGGSGTVSLKEGLEMTLPGIYAEESAKRGGEVLRMVYPWDPDWSCEIK